ncbi:hypothetical protein N9V68_01585 [Octadecabacter sp.]|nr:hypothetical protein [Octadecabacter sp.]
MTEFPQLEKRILDALSRIRAGVDGLAAPQPAAAPPPIEDDSVKRIEELTATLDDERTANAQLEERVKLLKERQDGKVAELEGNVETARARGSRMDRELQRLRQTNAELRDNNSQLRAAVTAGISEPHLVNKAMMAELEALRAMRSADAAEMDAILEELTPIIEQEAADATG